jgi:hypothetical protein
VKKIPTWPRETPLPEEKPSLQEEKPLHQEKTLSPRKDPPQRGKIPSPRENPFNQSKNPSPKRENALPKGKIYARLPQNRKKTRSRIDLGSKAI